MDDDAPFWSPELAMDPRGMVYLLKFDLEREVEKL